MRVSAILLLAAAGAFAALGCGGGQKGAAKTELKVEVPAPWSDPGAGLREPGPLQSADAADLASALDNSAAGLVAITGGTVMTAAGQTFAPGTVLTRGGRIVYVGPVPSSLPADAQVIDAKGKHVTPGIIDIHSHLGVYASPGVDMHSDGNEATSPATANARALYGYWPQDPGITRARAGGVTSALILPGSANLVGGLGQPVIMRPARHAREIVFPGAPPSIKMACGENPKRVYGEKGGPQTRMGEYAAFRALFQQAAEYDAKWRKYEGDRALWEKKREQASRLQAKAEKEGDTRKVAGESAPDMPPRDDKLEALAAVLRGEVLVQIHCYRATEIAEMVAIADEFDFPIRTFHHALGAYKVRDMLVERGIAIATWADWWGFKMESFDGIRENAGLFAESGGRAIIHSDSSADIQRLNQEAAKAYYAAREAGVELSDDDALRWITANPAWAMGVDKVVGTLENGKRADVVVWSAHPFSVYSRADFVMQAGEIAYRRDQGIQPTDFELGNWGLDADDSQGAGR